MRRKRHHAVPVHYLTRFVGQTGKLWQHMRGAREPQQVHPSKAAVEKYLYALEAGEDPYNDSVEVWLADNIDGPAAALIRKLIAKGSLRGDDRARFAVFLALQEIRIPRFRDVVGREMSNVGKTILQVLAEHDPDGLRELLATKGVELNDTDFEELMVLYRAGDANIAATKATWLESFALANEMAPQISALAWIVVPAPGDFEFVTSDAPVVKVLTRSIPSPRHAGWRAPSIEGIFPLDPKHLLFIRRAGRARRDEGSLAWCRRMNERTLRFAHRFVYSRRRERFIEEVWAESGERP